MKIQEKDLIFQILIHEYSSHFKILIQIENYYAIQFFPFLFLNFHYSFINFFMQ